MTTQIDHANLLRSLHIKGDPLILFNIWDAGSARAIEHVGAKVLATGSWSVAASHGFNDGEKLPFDLVLANLSRIIKSVNLPVTVDIEGGYGKSPRQLQTNVKKIIEAGAVGINFEDRIIGGKKLHSIEDQCARIKAIHAIAKETAVPFFINARTDIFFRNNDSDHNDFLIEEAIKRATAYARSGADCFFVPGLKNPKYIEKLCQLSPIPINILILSYPTSPKPFANLGVSRISYGPSPYCQVIDELKKAGRRAFSDYFY